MDRRHLGIMVSEEFQDSSMFGDGLLMAVDIPWGARLCWKFGVSSLS